VLYGFSTYICGKLWWCKHGESSGYRHCDWGLLACVREQREDVHGYDVWVETDRTIYKHDWRYAYCHKWRWKW
jgi:hypothetical protein